MYKRNSNNQPQYDVQIRVGIPNEFEKKVPYSVCVTAGIESDKVSTSWILKTHQGIDKIIVPSLHAKNGFIKREDILLFLKISVSSKNNLSTYFLVEKTFFLRTKKDFKT